MAGIPTALAAQPPRGALNFVRVPGTTPCTRGGVSAEGAFDRGVDLARALEMLCILGEPVLVADEGRASVGDDIDVFAEGAVTVRAPEGHKADALLEKVRQLIVRGELCVGCGVCVARCKAGALSIPDTIVRLEPAVCVHCGACLGPCPVVDFPPTEDFGF
jgi:phosphoadenosine phosphosulfate reductase